MPEYLDNDLVNTINHTLDLNYPLDDTVGAMNNNYNNWYFCSFGSNDLKITLNEMNRTGDIIYSNSQYSNYYFKVYIPKYINQVRAYLENDAVKKKLNAFDELKVLSLGCGPGNDIFALSYLQKKTGSPLMGVPISYKGVDSGNTWKVVHDKLEENEANRFKIRFKNKDIRDFVQDPEELSDYKPNLILINYVFSDMQKYCAREFLQKYLDCSSDQEKIELIEEYRNFQTEESISIPEDVSDNRYVAKILLEELKKLEKSPKDFLQYVFYQFDNPLVEFVCDLEEYLLKYCDENVVVIACDYYDNYASNYTSHEEEEYIKQYALKYGWYRNIGDCYLAFLGEDREVYKTIDNVDVTTLNTRVKEMEAIIGPISDFRGAKINSKVVRNEYSLFKSYSYINWKGECVSKQKKTRHASLSLFLCGISVYQRDKNMKEN